MVTLSAVRTSAVVEINVRCTPSKAGFWDKAPRFVTGENDRFRAPHNSTARPRWALRVICQCPFEPSKVDAAARTFCRYRRKADIRCRRTKAGSAGQTRYPSCFTLGWRRAASFNDSQADKSRNHKMQPWMPSHRGHKVMLCKNLTSPLSVPSADGASNEALA